MSDTENATQMETPRPEEAQKSKPICLTKAHQIATGVFSILVILDSVYGIFVTSYNLHTFSAFRWSLQSLMIRLFIITFAALLIMATFFGKNEPLQWFGLLRNYIGLGSTILFLSLITFGTTFSVGIITGVFGILFGIATIVWGFQQDTQPTFETLIVLPQKKNTEHNMTTPVSESAV